jgi:hypothetical protein
MKASNFTVNADMRWRRSSKLKSTFGNWVRGFGCGDIGAAAREDIEVENGCDGVKDVVAEAIFIVLNCLSQIGSASWSLLAQAVGVLR